MRPYFTAEEIREAVARGIDPAQFPHPDGGQVSLVPNPAGEGYLCPAFDPATSHCRIYEVRPLDCQIYPLALMWAPAYAVGERREARGERGNSSLLPIAYGPSPVNADEGPEVVLGWDTKCPFTREGQGRAARGEGWEEAREGEGQEAMGNRPEPFPSPIAPRLSPAVVAHAERVAALLDERYLDTIAANPQLIGRFQDDVRVIRSLPNLTARLREAEARGEGLGARGSQRSKGQTPAHGLSPLAPRPFMPADLARFEAACAAVDSPLAAFAPAPHLVWCNLFTYSWAEVDGQFCLFADYADGVYMPLPPLPLTLPSPRRGEGGGEGGTRHEAMGDRPESAPWSLATCPSPAALAACFAYMRERNRGTAVSRIENVPEKWGERLAALGYRLTKKDPDYLYRASDLVALAGDRYKSQRAACNRVIREHRCEWRPYRLADREACLTLVARWRNQQESRPIGEMARLLLHDAESAHREALSRAEALGLTGRVASVDGEVRAYTFGYARSRTVFCVLLEVADRTISGLAQWVFRECCREAVEQRYEFINTMDDSGLPALAATKRAYHPLRLVPSFIASKE